jgi:hypothetical protein
MDGDRMSVGKIGMRLGYNTTPNTFFLVFSSSFFNFYYFFIEK